MAEWVGPWLLLLLPLAAVAWRTVPVLLARYDAAALRVSPPLATERLVSSNADADVHARVWPVLLRWCFDGASPGNRPWWRPWAPPLSAVTADS